MAGTAEAVNLYPENELVRRRPDQFIGRVAIEGLQAKYDAITELAELTDGQMRIELELTWDDDDLYGPDGRSLTTTAQNGLKAAREQAKDNGKLWFEVGRRSLEVEEIEEVKEKIRQRSANTMILTTDFPEILRDAEEDIGGYNVTRQQALRRAITINPVTGKIMLISQTLDGSNRQALEAVDAEFGFQTKQGQMLGQRHFTTMTAEEQSVIMDRSVAAYDCSMTAQFGGEWYAGRRPVDYRNTYDFVCQQRDLIDLYKDLKLSGRLTDEVMYNLGATINARFKESKAAVGKAQPLSLLSNVVVPLNYNPGSLYQEMWREGNKARSEGRTFSACGSTFKAETDDKLKEGLLGDLDKSTQPNKSKTPKRIRCIKCSKESRREEVVKADSWHCPHCNYRVDICTGKVMHESEKPKPETSKPAKVISLEKFRRAKQATL